jgi:glutaredoxin
MAMVVMPFTINAETKDPITVHIFRGEGCGYCAAALEFFDSIEEEYGDYFTLEKHEVWSDEDNATLMTNVASYFGETVTGVPYIVIGDVTFQGYSESYDDDIISAITEAYESGNFVDIVAGIQDGTITTSATGEKDNNTTTIIIIVVAIIGFAALFYFARDTEVEVKEENKSEEKKEAVKVEKTTEKKATTAKKTTSTKKATSAKKPEAKKTTKNTSTKKTTTKKSSKK